MSRSQRSKGKRGELEALAALREYGIQGRRILTQTRDAREADLETDAGLIEVKRRASGCGLLYKALDQNECDLVMFRADGRGWLVVMKLERWAKQ
jgi:hypothetical protein